LCMNIHKAWQRF